MSQKNSEYVIALCAVLAVICIMFIGFSYIAEMDEEASESPAYAGNLENLSDPTFVSATSWKAMVAASFDSKAASSLLGRSQFRSLDTDDLPSLDACRYALGTMTETLMMTEQNFTHVDVRGSCVNMVSGKGVTFAEKEIRSYVGT